MEIQELKDWEEGGFEDSKIRRFEYSRVGAQLFYLSL